MTEDDGGGIGDEASRVVALVAARQRQHADEARAKLLPG